MNLWYKIMDFIEERKRILIIALPIIIAVTVSAIFAFNYYNKDRVSNYKTVLAALVEEGENRWEVYKCYDKQCILIVKNGDIQSKKQFKVSQEEAKAMTLPDMEGIKANDITKNGTYCKATWDASIGDVAQQIKWYETMGFKTVFKAQTQQFIEIYMKNDNNEYKRLLVTQGKVSVADTGEFEFKSIEDYVY